MAQATPQAAAMAWVEAVVDRGDLARAWPMTDPTLRLVLAQDWVWSHRHELPAPDKPDGRRGVTPAHSHQVEDWDAIARGLAACPSEHPLWDRFAADVIALWQQIWKGFSTRTWSTFDEPEVLGLDLEMVTFVETDESSGPLRGNYAFARRFAMIHTDSGWLVASVNGDQLFRPGWPPTLGRHAG
jgi:hypothetical protein